jgi:predicted nucleotidyltransferase
LSSVAIRSVDLVQIRKRVDEYATWLLRSRPEVEEIVVFGSFADGTYAPGSDLDVFLLLSRSEKAVRDRVPDYLPGAFPVGVDLFPYTLREVDSLRPSPLLDAVDASEWRYRRE